MIDERLETAPKVGLRHDTGRPICHSRNRALRGSQVNASVIHERSRAAGPSMLPISSYASPIDEAQTLVRRCAEPRPAAEQVKAAVRRASQRLVMPFSRTRDIWYGDARRIDAHEMDKLRSTAVKVELDQAVAGIEVLRKRMQAAGTPASLQVVAGLDAALYALGLNSAEVIP